jgi:hypothetical protein
LAEAVAVSLPAGAGGVLVDVDDVEVADVEAGVSAWTSWRALTASRKRVRRACRSRTMRRYMMHRQPPAVRAP